MIRGSQMPKPKAVKKAAKAVIKKEAAKAVRKVTKKTITTPPHITRPNTSLCEIHRPPFQEEVPGTGQRSGSGTGGITFGLFDNFGRSDRAVGGIRIHSELYHFSDSDVSNNGNGFHTHFLSLRDSYRCFNYQATGAHRLKFTIVCSINKLTHDFTRRWRSAVSRGSRFDYLCEFHVLLPGGNEILKFELARRNLSGSTNYSRTVDMLAAGSEITLVATTTRTYPVRDGISYHMGLYTDHKVHSQNVFLRSVCEADIKIKNVQICTVV